MPVIWGLGAEDMGTFSCDLAWPHACVPGTHCPENQMLVLSFHLFVVAMMS